MSDTFALFNVLPVVVPVEYNSFFGDGILVRFIRHSFHPTWSSPAACGFLFIFCVHLKEIVKSLPQAFDFLTPLRHKTTLVIQVSPLSLLVWSTFLGWLNNVVNGVCGRTFFYSCGHTFYSLTLSGGNMFIQEAAQQCMLSETMSCNLVLSLFTGKHPWFFMWSVTFIGLAKYNKFK